MSIPTVMISSTARDLPEEREAILKACLKLKMMPDRMEDLPASSGNAISVSLEMVDRADIYVGVFAHRYGYVPEGEVLSITHMELNRAMERGIPVLIFIIDDNVPVLPKNMDRGALGEKIYELKETLKDTYVVNFFTSPEDLKTKALHSLGEVPLNPAEQPTAPILPGPHSSLKPYLQKIYKECQVLPLGLLGGISKQGKAITLNEVYIGLNTTTQVKEEENAEVTESREADAERGDEEKEAVYLSAQEVADQESHLVLLGDPGSGKSTFVKQLVAQQAKQGLDHEQDAVPVMIVLRDLAPRLVAAQQELDAANSATRRWVFSRLVLELVADNLNTLGVPASADAIKEAFSSGNVFLVLDGLDEVPVDVRKRVREAVDAVLKCHTIKQIIVTCRVRSYTEENRLSGFGVHTLAPFTEEQIDHFIAGWYGAQVANDALQQGEGDELAANLKQAVRQRQLRTLAENPMLMTTMIMVHQQETELPRERVVLYNKAVDILLHKWQQGKKVIPADLEDLFKSQEKIRPVIERLAYEAHKKGDADTESDLPRAEAISLLEEMGFDLAFAGRFLDYVDESSGLLVGRGGGPRKPAVYSFPHRTFQEYLAGCYIVNQRSAVRDMRELATEGEFWTVAIQLGAQELLFNRRNQNQLLDNAAQLLGDVTNTHTAREALWSGYMAQVVGKEEVLGDKETGQKYLDRLGAALVSSFNKALPPLERAEAGRLLGAFGDPRRELLTLEGMQFSYVPEGPFLMGDNAVEVDVPYGYWIGVHTVTHAQYQFFVDAGGYTDQRWWTDAGKAFVKDKTGPENYGTPFTYPNHPRVGVSWYEAYAFTQWLTEEAHNQGWLDPSLRIALPNEPEWEKAARGGLKHPEIPAVMPLVELKVNPVSMRKNGEKSRTYPWGQKYVADHCNNARRIGTTVASGCFPEGVSVYGSYEMSGNVSEWSRSNMGGKVC